MYQKIVVPLDCSEVAERVLPHVEELVKSCSTEEIILVTVAERIIATTGVTQVIPSVGPLPPPQPVYKVPVVIGKSSAFSCCGRSLPRPEVYLC